MTTKIPPVVLGASDVEASHDLSNYQVLEFTGQPGKQGGPQLLRLFAHGTSSGSSPATVQFALVTHKKIIFTATATITPTSTPSGSGRVVGTVAFTDQNSVATNEKLDLLGTHARDNGGRRGLESTTQGAVIWMFAPTDLGNWSELTLEGVVGEVV